MINLSFSVDALDWDKSDGLVPVIVQDAQTLRVLMLGYMNKDALAATCASGFVTFFSRSKQRLWQKGESSGHVLHVRHIAADCDRDTLLILADPAGPTCHTGTTSCFGDKLPDLGGSLAVLPQLEATIRARKENPSQESYTASLFAHGIARIAQKVGEEGVEVALAGALDQATLTEEAADLFYHVLVLLAARGASLSDVMGVLAQRAQKRTQPVIDT